VQRIDVGGNGLGDLKLAVRFLGSLRSRKSFSARRPSSNSTSIMRFSSAMFRALSAASRYTAMAFSP